MSGYVLVLVLGLFVALGAAGALWWHLRRRERPASSWVPRDWCDVCQEPLSDRQVHTLTSADEMTVDGMVGGTAISADYCAAHCPGGCHRGC